MSFHFKFLRILGILLSFLLLFFSNSIAINLAALVMTNQNDLIIVIDVHLFSNKFKRTSGEKNYFYDISYI